MFQWLIEFLRQNWAAALAVYAAALSSWNVWHTWRRQRSRFRIRIIKPVSYKEDPLIVLAILTGGPPIKVTKCRARVLGVEDYEALEVRPKGDDSVLRSEHREVEFHLNAKFLSRIWYVQVQAESEVKRLKLLRVIPPFWVEKMKLSPFWASEYGAVLAKGELEKDLKNVARIAKRQFVESEKRDSTVDSEQSPESPNRGPD